MKRLLYLNVRDGQPWKRQWFEREESRRSAELGFHQRFEDLAAVVGLLHEGQDAAEIFGWGLPALPVFLKHRAGPGKVYAIDACSDYELLLHLVEMYDSYQSIVGGAEQERHYFNHGTVLLYNEGFLESLERSLAGIDVERVRQLNTLFPKPEAQAELRDIAKTFYDLIGIDAIEQLLPPYPDIQVDAVMEHNGFSFCDESRKEGVIRGADRILRPGGYMAFKDIPLQLATVEYYGADIFQRYTPISLELHNPKRWLILQKAV